ncbi:Hydantoin racemase [Paraburkholderia domus]|jgi:Hydantoin racemase|uniref:aspartate/glutamate racemase family protein n=1 Tax=Paraburkholderia domus TaxID=2793075 RepID=UPI001914C5CD|nr:aspartate/glutamate racemase family protein [Paraburkholderia domus]MBK5051677.1 hydantoin racemase [Burkholderia sp. R-70006]MCI0151645.1 hydantoin racemase [Paraburkholderia sediminicola]CAE6789730.1 Hydantoin racemase [Paraburkholderia domus]CAE6793731.1 Hydantoin racemase [Paraburkholderia domus]
MNHHFNGEPTDAPVTVRWLNPVGYAAWDTPIGQLLHSIKQPSTTVEVVSFDMTPTPTHLEYRTYEALIHERTVAVSRDSAVKGIDALVVGCFYDPALEGAREISGQTVVVGPCQASVQIAVNLANRFSVIVGREKWIEQMTDRIRGYGLLDRLASMPSLGMGVNDFQAHPEVTRQRIIEEARRAVDEDHAEALILGCTIEFGFFEAVQQAVGVPVIDPVVAAFKMAESLAKLKKQFGWAPSRVWSCEPPPESELSDFGLFQGPAPIANAVMF